MGLNQFSKHWKRWWTVSAIAFLAFFWTLPTPASPLLHEFASLKHVVAHSVGYSRAIADPKPALVEFYADWCNVCRAMAPTIEQLHEQYGDRVNFVMLNIDDPITQPQVEQFGVRGVPHYALIGEIDTETGNRSSFDTLVGRYPDFVMENYIAQLIAS